MGILRIGAERLSKGVLGVGATIVSMGGPRGAEPT